MKLPADYHSFTPRGGDTLGCVKLPGVRGRPEA